jgi:hypothetical protein
MTRARPESVGVFYSHEEHGNNFSFMYIPVLFYIGTVQLFI